MSSDAESDEFLNNLEDFDSINESWELNEEDGPNQVITKKELAEFKESIKRDMTAMETRIVKEIRDHQLFMKKALFRILKDINSMKHPKKKKPNSTKVVEYSEIYPKVPFSDIKEFNKFEMSIKKDEKKFAALVQKFSEESVDKPIKFIKVCWRKLIKDEAAQHLCWRGTDKKIAVNTLSTTAAIKEAYCRSCSETSDTEFAKTCIYYFQQAKARCQKKDEYHKYI